VTAFKVGDRVAAVGPHAGVVVVGENLCARMPDNVTFEQAAYTAVGAIALEGVRLAHTSLGARVLVIGLGLIGQLAASLLKANGVHVIGTDLDPRRLEQANALGIDTVTGDDVRARALSISGGHGVDAVLIAASTTSNQPVELAAEVCRQKGRIVLVGVAGLAIPRPPFFEKELEFTVSHSLGAGRSDTAYEDKGVDYPIGYARWTAKRNMETVLETMSNGMLPVEKLTTHRFPIERAPEAYDLMMSGGESLLGVLLTYDRASASPLKRRLTLSARPAQTQTTGVSVIGAGNFARLVLLPELQSLGDIALRGVCSAKGMSAEHTGRKAGFAFAATDPDEVFADRDTSAVFVLTRHDLHADLVIRALSAGKHVFVEKPLCITPEELQNIAGCIEALGEESPMLMVGFNRRFAPATERIRSHFAGVSPLAVTFRFAVPELPREMWVHDRDVGGGRIVGEACHAIDTCVAITGSAPARVFAESSGSAGAGDPLDDRVFITIRHENGSISNISYQAGGDRTGPTERIEVFGGGRTAVVEGWDRIELWAGNRRTTAGGNKDKGHKAEVGKFIKACRDGGAWPISWFDLYGTTWASLMAVRSLREGRPIASVETSEAAPEPDLIIA
jgi:predicted dehydrogenase